MISIAEIIVQCCQEMHIPMIQDVFGNVGVDAAFQVMETVKSLYKHVEPERITGRVVVYRLVQLQGVAVAPPVSPPADFAALANLPITDLALEVGSDGRTYLRSIPDITLEELAQTAVVYHWRAGLEEFLAGTERKAVARLDPAARSQFAIPTFSDLREALRQYAVQNVRESTCYIFRDVWFSENRLFLKAGPEDIMRNSLTLFLRNRMSADHDVWPEQVVDESHPVDIRVQPRLSNNRLMLIEIKWLGCSVKEDGHATARHGNPRAQKGADQLAQYLEEQRRSAPTRVIQGYYVIIDARRERLHQGATSISHADGMFYEDKELTFDPAHHLTRSDFDPPYRMFARPVCAS
jgi:hypothetical protein